MRTVFLGIFLLLKSAVCSFQERRVHGHIRHFAVGNGKVFIVTDSQLLQMDYDLTEEKRKDISNQTHPNQVNILLPFSANETLITCGTAGGGYCEVLNINDITHSIYREEVWVGPSVNRSAVAFLVQFKEGDAGTSSYMLVAKEKSSGSGKVDDGVTLRNTLHSQPGEIFSKSGKNPETVDLKTKSDLEWVDGFQTSSPSHSYLLVNVETGPAVMVLRMKNSESKGEMIKSLHGATLECCDDKARRKLLSSSAVVSADSPLLWVGVFTAEDEQDPENTAVVIYNFSQITNQTSPDLSCIPGCTSQVEGNPVLRPLDNKAVFKHTSITSVAAEKIESWIVLYIGTAQGQLMKIGLDKNLKAGCVKVLHQTEDDSMVLPRMYIVDHKYIYMALRNQIMQVAVNRCGIYSSLKECMTPQDPSCGWCVTTSSCTSRDECSDSSWIPIPEDFGQKELITFNVNEVSAKVTLNLHLNLKGKYPLNCTFMVAGGNLCDNITEDFQKCSCTFPEKKLPAEVTANVSIGNHNVMESLKLRSCPNITETSPYAWCLACISAGCYWSSSSQSCSWTLESQLQGQRQDVCQGSDSGTDTVVIHNVKPNEVSFSGKNNVTLTGNNLGEVKKIRFQGFPCTLQETPVLTSTRESLTFNLPSGNKGIWTICAVTEDGKCHSKATITYGSLPACTGLHPKITWQSGKRKIRVFGNNLKFVDAVIIDSSAGQTEVTLFGNETFWFHTPHLNEYKASTVRVSLTVGNKMVHCANNLSYHTDPKLISFTTTQVDKDVLVTIQKREDRLNLTLDDVTVVGLKEKNQLKCITEAVKATTVICRISGEKDAISLDSLRIVVGRFEQVIMMAPNTDYLYVLCGLILLILLGAVVGVFIHRKSKQQLSAQMNERLELLESEIRNEIRQGFVDLQTEKSDLIENVSAIPFLDYKHFALKIFFPEGGPLASLMIKDIGQDAVKIEADEKCWALSALIQDQMFLTCFVHALEEQKNFGIKDKCTVASLLTIALHDDLPYLTQLMENLLQSLMDQPSNTQPKLLLRRTESIVEKLLTNWMSICLYGFLRESVGQPLFLLVSALIQQISKGPVDAVTEKALYTLNEDWLLWQAQDFNFSPLKLKVLFAVGTEGEVSEPLEVNALTCDTIEQVKEKILQTFQCKFGFPYTQQLREIDIEYEKEQNYVPLEEVDNSSEVQGEVTMLNTLKHYQIPDGASIKVMTKKVHAPLSPQTSLKDDQNFSTKYFHLIDPEIDRDERNHPERKKLKLKEIYLTKLLSTKVAVHSFVENLFRSIWGMPYNKAPSAVKYFFDFLDVQAEKKRITDPDVLHIWKTNSLPLRFWVNILKNPNFVFSDLEKTPHLDACLSVIAQAFMDSFSLTDQQLGKHAPTNKLLYAKDIPQYKQEVKAYYKMVRDQSSINCQDFNTFLQEESKKHENEFNASAALRELYKYMQRYFSEIIDKLDQMNASSKLKEEMHHVKDLFEDMKRSAWF